MHDASQMSPEQFQEHCRRSRQLEPRMRMKRDRFRRAGAAIGAINVMYARTFADRFFGSNLPGGLELRMIDLPFPCEEQRIDGFRIAPASLNGGDKTLYPLSRVDMKHMIKILAAYEREIRSPRFKDKDKESHLDTTRRASREYWPLFRQMIELSLYEPLNFSPENDRLVMYVSFPHDPLLKRVEHQLYLAETKEPEPTEVQNDKLGRWARRRLRKEGEKNRQNVYLVWHPATVITGQELAQYAAAWFQEDYFRRRPDALEAMPRMKELIAREKGLEDHSEPGVSYKRLEKPREGLVKGLLESDLPESLRS